MSSFTVTVICIRDIFVTVMLTHIQGSPYARNMSKHVKCIHLFNSHQKNTKNNTLKGGHSCYSHYKFYLSTFYHNLFGLCCLMCVYINVLLVIHLYERPQPLLSKAQAHPSFLIHYFFNSPR